MTPSRAPSRHHTIEVRRVGQVATRLEPGRPRPAKPQAKGCTPTAFRKECTGAAWTEVDEDDTHELRIYNCTRGSCDEN